jgi:hypothetical protein
LILREVAIEVALNHVRMPSMLLRVCRRATQDLREKRRDVAWMVSAHVREDRCEQRVAFYVLVEPRCQTVQGIDAAEPLVKGWNGLIGHDNE